MATNITNSSNTKKARPLLFTVPLGIDDRNELEELAAIQNVSMAAATRSSIHAALCSAKKDQTTDANDAITKDQFALMNTLLAIYQEITVIRSNTNNILKAIPLNQEILLDKLTPTVTNDSAVLQTIEELTKNAPYLSKRRSKNE